MYGIQTPVSNSSVVGEFENDVKMYGIQTQVSQQLHPDQFENDVKMYGIQTLYFPSRHLPCLRMM